MKKYFMYLMAVVFAGLMFTSCEKKSDADLLVGKWSVTSISFTEEGRTFETKIEGNEYIYYTFVSGGKYVRDYNFSDYKDSENGTWVLDGKQLTLTMGQGAQEDHWYYTIQELTASKLTMEERTVSNKVLSVYHLEKVK